MNFLSDFHWIGEQTKCLDRKLLNKNYAFYTGCVYLSTEYEIGTGVVIRSNNISRIGIIHYFFEALDLDNADKYRIAVEFYYKPKDILPHLILNNDITLHSDFELLKQNKPVLSFLPIKNIKLRCTIVYGLEDEKPDELLKEFYETTNDAIYICRYSAFQNHEKNFRLTGVIHNEIEISDSDDENKSNQDPLNTTEITIPSATKNLVEYKVGHIDKQNENIRIKILRTQTRGTNTSNDNYSDPAENVSETNDIFTISNVVGDSNQLKLRFTRTNNVSTVLVSSFTSKSQTDVIVNNSKLSAVEKSQNQDDIHNLRLSNRLVDQPIQIISNIDLHPKQTIKQISLAHSSTDDQSESESSEHVKQEILSVGNHSDSEPPAFIISKVKSNNKVTVFHTNKKKVKSINSNGEQTKQNRTSSVCDDFLNISNPSLVKVEPDSVSIEFKNQTNHPITKSEINSIETVPILSPNHTPNNDKSPQKKNDCNTIENTDNILLKKKHYLQNDSRNEYKRMKPQTSVDGEENQTSIIQTTKQLLQTKSLILYSKTNPVVVMEKLSAAQISRLCKMNERDELRRKRDIVREDLLRQINDDEDSREKSSKKLKWNACVDDCPSTNLRRSTRPKTSIVYKQPEESDHSSDSQLYCKLPLRDKPQVNSTRTYKTHVLRPKTPVKYFDKKQEDFFSPNHKKENISPYQTPTNIAPKPTETHSRPRVRSVSEINSSFSTYTAIENQETKNAEIDEIPQNKSLASQPKNSNIEYTPQRRQSSNISASGMQSSDYDSAISELTIIRNTETKNNISSKKRRPHRESVSDSSYNESSAKSHIICSDIELETPKNEHQPKYGLRPRTPHSYYDLYRGRGKRVSSRKKSKKNETPDNENMKISRTTMQAKQDTDDDSEIDVVNTPTKKVKIVSDRSTPVKSVSKLARKRLKNMTPGIEEREEAVASCSTPMQKARVGLSAYCIPTNMPCRESEYLNIYNFIAGRIKNKSSGCMYISGVPGTGKTMTVCKVMRSITENTKSCPVKFLKLNALALTEPRQIYVEIVKSLLSKTLHWEEALSEIQRFFKKSGKQAHILMIDELDKLCNRKQDVIYNLLDLPFHSSTPLVVITIANTMDLPERILTNKVNSRLGLTRLTFKPYHFKELVQIVTARLSNTKVFKSEALELVARKVAAVSGDARRALAMCSRATEIAEEEEHDQVTMEIINKVMYEMISSSSSQAVKSCSKFEKFILTAISNEMARTGNEEVAFASMLENLRKICYLEKMSMPGIGICLKLCQRLGGLRLLITQHARFDLNMILMLNISPDDIHFALC